MEKEELLSFLDFVQCNKPEKFLDLLKILHDFTRGAIDVEALVMKVRTLLDGDPELITNFNWFLPDSHKLPGCFPDATHAHALNLILNVKRRFENEPFVYIRFVQLGEMHREEKLSSVELCRNLSALLRCHPDLVEYYHKHFVPAHVLLACRRRKLSPDSPSPPSSSRARRMHSNASKRKAPDAESPSRGDKKQMIHKQLERTDSSKHDSKRADLPSDLVNYADYPRCSPSYCLLPVKEQRPLDNFRTAIGKEVLNNAYKSVDFSVCSAEKNADEPRKSDYDEALLLRDDDMFELDMLMESVESTIRSLEEIMKTINEPSGLYDRLTARNKRCIENLYGDKGIEILEILCTGASCALPCILARLKQKRREYELCRKQFLEVWRKIAKGKRIEEDAMKEDDEHLSAAPEDQLHAVADTENGDSEEGSNFV